MSRTKLWILNLVGGTCALLIVCNLALNWLNNRLNARVQATQGQFNQAQRLQTTTQNLVVRVAQLAQQDPVLEQLLVKHEFRTSPNPNPTGEPAKVESPRPESPAKVSPKPESPAKAEGPAKPAP